MGMLGLIHVLVCIEFELIGGMTTQDRWWLLFIRYTVSSSLRPHGLRHTRLACPSLSPGVCSNSCPWSQWCNPTISSSATSFSSCPQSFPVSGVFPMAQLFPSLLGLQLQHQSFQWIFRVDFFYDWLVWSPCCPRDSQESSPAPQFEHRHTFWHWAFCVVQFSHPYMTTGKVIINIPQIFLPLPSKHMTESHFLTSLHWMEPYN